MQPLSLMRYSSRNLVRKSHTFRLTGAAEVKYCILPSHPFRSSIPFPRLCAFNPASASPCCVYSTCSSPRLFYHLRFICSLLPCNAGFDSCLLQIHSPFLIPSSVLMLLCAISDRLSCLPHPPASLGSVSPLFCALFFLSFASFDPFRLR